MTSLVLFAEMKAHLNTSLSTDDADDATAIAAIRQLIEEESGHLERMARRRFDHRVETRYYDLVDYRDGGAIDGVELLLDDDLLSVDSIDNAGTAISSGYALLPRSPVPHLTNSPKWRIRLDSTGTQFWGETAGAAVDPVAAISVTGIWGYGGQWIDTGLTGSLANTSETALAVTGLAKEQETVLRMEGEYLRISAVTDDDNVTVERAYNGSTAAAHDAVPIYTFQAEAVVRTQVRRLVAWRLAQEESPLYGVINVADSEIPVNISSVPSDVQAALRDANLLKRNPLRMYAV